MELSVWRGTQTFIDLDKDNQPIELSVPYGYWFERKPLKVIRQATEEEIENCIESQEFIWPSP